MIRLLFVFLIPAALLGAAGWFLWESVLKGLKVVANVEFAYVRFRDGVLVLKRTTRFTSEEIQFSPTQEFAELGPKQLAAHAGGATWYTFPEGRVVGRESEESQAIQRCLRFANSTGLLEAERATE